jgi:hypothetical protein
VSTESRERELIASEQMRDRIADYVSSEIARRNPNSNAGAKVRKALVHIESAIRQMPGRPAR